MSNILETLKTLIKYGFPGRGGSKFVIVDSTNPFSGSTAISIEILSEVTGLAVIDNANDSDVAYPEELPTGFVTFGTFTSVSVADGLVKVYLS